jgi:hypothetical protein
MKERRIPRKGGLVGWKNESSCMSLVYRHGLALLKRAGLLLGGAFWRHKLLAQ